MHPGLRMAVLVPIIGLLTTLSSGPPFTPRHLSRYRMAKARWLLEHRLSCLGCHELSGEGGRIGPSFGGLRTRRGPDAVYRMIADPQHTLPGTIMPREPITDDTRALVSSYLLQLDAKPAAVPLVSRLPAPVTQDSGAIVYARVCALCHGPRGAGDGPNAPYLPVRPTAHADAAGMSAHSDASLYDAIAAGGALDDRSARMPAFGETFTPAQIHALVNYLRALCRCRGPAWSDDNR